MKTIFSYHSAIRLLSLALLALAGSIYFLFFKEYIPLVHVLCVSLLASSGVLMCIPVSMDSPSFSLYASLGFIAVVAIFCILGLSIFVIIPVMCVGTLTYTALRTARKYSRIRMLFNPNAIRNEVDDYAKLLYACFYQFVAAIALLCLDKDVCVWPVAALEILLYVLLYVKAYTGYTLMISPKKERKIDDMLKASLQGGFKTDDEQEIARMKALYERCESLMKTKKSFLDPDFSLEDLALRMFTNKTLLSRTINSFSGRNFRQYVNFHRIQYALELLSRDPKLKITELSVLSGFNTTVSFTMAFKLNVGETPSNYRESLSSSVAEAL